MNRLHTLLTALAFGTVGGLSSASAMPVENTLRQPSAAVLLVPVQLGNGGPVGSGAFGTNNGTGLSGGSPSVNNPSGAYGGSQSNGTATTPGSRVGGTTGGTIRPNTSSGQPNGAKPAPMRANGVRKVQ